MSSENSRPFGRRLSSSDASLNQALGGGNVTRPTASSSSKAAATRTAGEEAFQARPARYHLDDIILPASARRSIERLIASVRNYEQLSQWAPTVFDSKRKYLAVNFYGPPGTGKTMCAEALASEFRQPLLEVNYAELESELWGKSSKNIQLAFRRAHEQSAVLFFDEADSVLASRIKTPGHSSDQHVNLSRSVLLKQLDSFAGIVFFATNLAKNYDRAFVRRIYQHIEVPLPDLEGRMLIWKRMLTPSIPGYHSLDWCALSQASDGLSGGDIANVIRQALPDLRDNDADTKELSLEILIHCIEDVRRSRRDVGEPGGPSYSHMETQ